MTHPTATHTFFYNTRASFSLSSVAWLPLLICLSFLSACQRLPEPEPPQPRPVRVIQLDPADSRRVIELSGEVRPRVESHLAFQVGGRLIERRADLGQRVRKGEVLARIDPVDQALQENAMRAQLAAATAEADQAQLDYSRAIDLKSRNFVSQAEVDRRKAALDAMLARVDAVRAQLGVQSNLARYTALVAPGDGYITAVDANVGQVVGPGVPVLRWAQSNDMELAVQIPEARIDEVRRMGEATVRFWADQDAVSARLREVSSMADPLTRGFPARLSLKKAPDGLQFGMSAVARFQRTESVQGFKIPMSALFAEEGNAWVYVLDEAEGVVRRTAIKPHDIDGNQFIVKEGLSQGQWVVVAGTHALRDGQPARRFIEPIRGQ